MFLCFWPQIVGLSITRSSAFSHVHWLMDGSDQQLQKQFRQRRCLHCVDEKQISPWLGDESPPTSPNWHHFCWTSHEEIDLRSIGRWYGPSLSSVILFIDLFIIVFCCWLICRRETVSLWRRGELGHVGWLPAMLFCPCGLICFASWLNELIGPSIWWRTCLLASTFLRWHWLIWHGKPKSEKFDVVGAKQKSTSDDWLINFHQFHSLKGENGKTLKSQNSTNS
jgi:hypothetical protein